ncbi:Ig-like domain-containing protein [Photobacterium leiognathi]|uniref:Ig-like domain-containing protein n=1 Tax=Photobacterium leiognathi TaxID=553611 RepID=UPI002980C5BC|nr:Ig-like domain-containing protein [Photobacterium leiognathi]
MLLNTVIKKGVAIFIVLSLTNYGFGYESPSVTPLNEPAPMLVLDGFSTVVPDVKTFIDLKPYLSGDNTQITGIQEDKNNPLCGVPTVNETGVYVQVKEGTFCQFNYTVEQSRASQVKASLNVLATKAAAPMLPPISQDLVIGDGTTTFNVQTLLGDSWKTTYRLNSNSVMIQGLESNLGTEVVLNNSIMFTPPALAGWNRIVFTLDDTASPSESVVGVIYVAMSEKVSHSPRAEYERYLYNFAPANDQYAVTWGQSRSDYPEGLLTEYDGWFADDKGDMSSPEQRKHAKDVMTKSLKRHGSIMVNMTPWTNGGFAARKLWVDDSDKALDETIFAWRVTKKEKPSWCSYIDYHGLIFCLGDENEETLYWRNIGGLWYTAAQSGVKPFIYKGEKLTVKLDKLPGLMIEEPEGDEWQLIDVHSYSSTVKLTESDSITNKTFDFTASTAGTHYVAYIISDNFGCYTVGIIQIDVSATGGVPSWVDIKTGGNTYTAPQTYAQATAAGYDVMDVWDTGVHNTVAGYRQQTANTYCRNVGILPTEADMSVLRNTYISGSLLKGSLAKWPVQQSYLIKRGNGFANYDLVTGGTKECNSTAATNSYVTCIVNNHFTLAMVTRNVVANDKPIKIATVTLSDVDIDALIIEKINGTLTEEEAGLSYVKVSDTEFDVMAQSIKAGTYQFSVTDGKNISVSTVVSYTGDIETAQFVPDSGLVISKGFAAYDGIDAVIVKATLTDANNNPVSGVEVIGEVVSGSSGDTANISPVRRLTTDHRGQIKFKLTNTTPEMIQIKVSAEPVDGYVIYSAEHNVLFSVDKYPCLGQVGNYDCIPIRAARNGDLYSTIPTYRSILWLTRIDPTTNASYGRTIALDYGNDVYEDAVITFTDSQENLHCDSLSRIKWMGRTNWAVPTLAQYTDSEGPFFSGLFNAVSGVKDGFFPHRHGDSSIKMATVENSKWRTDNSTSDKNITFPTCVSISN